MDQDFLIEETAYRSRAACTICWRSQCFIGKDPHLHLLKWMSLHYNLHQLITDWLAQQPEETRNARAKA